MSRVMNIAATYCPKLNLPAFLSRPITYHLLSTSFLLAASFISIWFDAVQGLRERFLLQILFAKLKNERVRFGFEANFAFVVSSLLHYGVRFLLHDAIIYIKSKKWSVKKTTWLKAGFIWGFNQASAYGGLHLKGWVMVLYLLLVAVSALCYLAFLLTDEDFGLVDCLAAVALSLHVRIPEHYYIGTVVISIMPAIKLLILLCKSNEAEAEAGNNNNNRRNNGGGIHVHVL